MPSFTNAVTPLFRRCNQIWCRNNLRRPTRYSRIGGVSATLGTRRLFGENTSAGTISSFCVTGICQNGRYYWRFTKFTTLGTDRTPGLSGTGAIGSTPVFSTGVANRPSYTSATSDKARSRSRTGLRNGTSSSYSISRNDLEGTGYDAASVVHGHRVNSYHSDFGRTRILNDSSAERGTTSAVCGFGDAAYGVGTTHAGTGSTHSSRFSYAAVLLCFRCRTGYNSRGSSWRVSPTHSACLGSCYHYTFGGECGFLCYSSRGTRALETALNNPSDSTPSSRGSTNGRAFWRPSGAWCRTIAPAGRTHSGATATSKASLSRGATRTGDPAATSPARWTAATRAWSTFRCTKNSYSRWRNEPGGFSTKYTGTS